MPDETMPEKSFRLFFAFFYLSGWTAQWKRAILEAEQEVEKWEKKSINC